MHHLHLVAFEDEPKVFRFKAPGTETLQGTAYFEVEAPDAEAALALLKADAAEYYVDFSESDGGVDWTENFEEI